jgi:hypothetical protein
MRKIITIITLFIMTFTSGFASVWDSIKLTKDDMLKVNIFYINWQGYVKEDWKLKKVEWIKFYSIAGQRYINKDGKITKITENKIHKINNINYVVDNWKLITLEKYLKENPIEEEEKKKTAEEFFKLEKKENLELKYLQQYKIDKIKEETINNLSKLILSKYPQNESSLQLIKKDRFSTDKLEKIRNYYYDLWEIEIATEVNKLVNISKIDIEKVNKVIRAKLNNEKINIINSDDDNDDWFDELFNEIINDTNDSNLETNEPKNNLEEENDDDYNNIELNSADKLDNNTEEQTSNNDADLEEIMKIFEWL